MIGLGCVCVYCNVESDLPQIVVTPLLENKQCSTGENSVANL